MAIILESEMSNSKTPTASKILKRRLLRGPTSITSGLGGFRLTRVSCHKFARITRILRLVYNPPDAHPGNNLAGTLSYRAPARAGRYGRRLRSSRSTSRYDCGSQRDAVY